MAEKVYYPIGEQDFRALRNDGCLYVDKTGFIRKIIESKEKYFFLSRPRRFGKSLFLSTLQYFFEGERSLFKGLDVDFSDWGWEKFPVIRLDLNTDRYEVQGQLEITLESRFNKWELEYGVREKGENLSARLRNIIEAAHSFTGKPVVILVDEYDKPLVNNLNRDENFEHYRARLASLYSNFKSSAEHIRLVFLTGVSRFSKLSVFSDLNNIKDISFSNEFADICGIAENELYSNFKAGIEQLSLKYEVSCEEMCRKLKENYDGYRFAEEGSDVYNPWSLLNAMSDCSITNYWNMTGMPTIIAESLKRIDADLKDILNVECERKTLIGLDLKSTDPLALLYQTGYLTIKHYDKEFDTFLLGVPNKEVKEGLFDVLLPYYVKVKRGLVSTTLSEIRNSINRGRPESLMKSLQSYFSGIPYELHMDNENNFHNAFYILVTLLGITSRAEVHTSNGSIDLLIESKDFIYIIELKYDGSPSQALRQIEEKGYALPFRADSRHVFKIGVNFSSKKRTIESWQIK